MPATTRKLKWLLALVLIFGGFAVYTFFGSLAADFPHKQYSWAFKVVSEFGLFLSVIISVGYFHHWVIAAEERKASQQVLDEALRKYVDSILLNSIQRGFSRITHKEVDFGEIMHGLNAGEYVCWLITFDPRYKHHCREVENAIKNGAHFRMLIIKDDYMAGDLRAREITGFDQNEFHEYAKLFKMSLDNVAGHLDESVTGSLGVFVSDGLPCVPLFIVIRNRSKKIEVYSSYYLAEPVGSMLYLRWESALKTGRPPSLESDEWNMADLFYNYFLERWQLEKNKKDEAVGKDQRKDDDFLFAPMSARTKCSELISDSFI